MIPDFVRKDLGLYQNHPVIVTYTDGHTRIGDLKGYDDVAVQIDDVNVSLSQLQDLEYYGVVSEYNRYPGKGMIDRFYPFSEDDLREEDKKDHLNLFILHEFTCQVACHLRIVDQIRATDVRLVSKAYDPNFSVLSKKAFLYRFVDGSYLCGALSWSEDGGYLLAGRPFQADRVVEVTRLPEINDKNVIAVMRDGSVHRGLVSAVQSDSFNLFAEGKPTPVFYKDLAQLRYVGFVTNRSEYGTVTIEGTYTFKAPQYLREEDADPLIQIGAEVSFVVGVNTHAQTGYIAKDVVVEHEADTIGGRDSYGILITADFSKEDGVGYIGKRWVAKACRTDQDAGGDTKFRRNQLDFKMEYSKVYIVQYSPIEQNGVRSAAQIKLHQELDGSTCGIVEVSDEGEVRVTPLFQAATHLFKGQDVDVTRKDGTIVSGLLQEYDASGITVVQGIGEDCPRQIVSFDAIQEIRVIETVTQLYYNGTGYAGQFFFHIRQVAPEDHRLISKGAQIIFTVRNSGKGNYIDCADIHIYPEEKKEVYVLSYQDKQYTVVDADQYDNRIVVQSNPYQVPYDKYNQFRDLRHVDYHAILTMRRRAGVTECAEIRSLNIYPKKHRGFVTDLDRKKNMITIMPEAAYTKSDEARVYPLGSERNLNLLSELDKKDYQVTYSLRVQDGEERATLDWVKKGGQDKLYFGYLETGDFYKPFYERGYCFITQDVNYRKGRQADRYTSGVYCDLRPKGGKQVFQNPPSQEELLDETYHFWVCYTLGATAQPQFGPPAKKVWFLEKVEPQQAPIFIPSTSSTGTLSSARDEMGLGAEMASGVAPLPEQGETLLIRLDGESWYAGNVSKVEGKQYVFDDGTTLEAEESNIIRFGVLTKIESDMTAGYLNGRTRFSFSTMESRTFNVVKAAKLRQLVWYTCQNGQINHVERVTSNFLAPLPFQWEYGTVTKLTDTGLERCLFVSEDIRCLLTVSTSGYLMGLIKKNNNIKGTPVFVKTVHCPYREKGTVKLRQYALDIHCQQEICAIRLDPTSNNYRVENNATKPVFVEGSVGILAALANSQQSATVSYRPTEDGRGLQASVEGDQVVGGNEAALTGEELQEQEELTEESMEISRGLWESSLVQHHLETLDWRSLQFDDGVELTEEGEPTDPERAIPFILAYKKPKVFDIKKAVAVVTLLNRLPEEPRTKALAELGVKTVEELLGRYLDRHISYIGRDNNCLWGEYSYYIITLLRDTQSPRLQKKEIYKLFLPVFYSRLDVLDEFRRQEEKPANLGKLFGREMRMDQESKRQMMARMVSLDEAAFQHLFMTEKVLEHNQELAKAILAWGKEVDSQQEFTSAVDLLYHLRLLYADDKKRFVKKLKSAAQRKNVLDKAKEQLEAISGRFLKLMDADDAQRFTALLGLCQSAVAKDNRGAGYRHYQAVLAEAWEKCDELLRESEKRLTQETTEMLLSTGLLKAVRRAIGEELNALYTAAANRPEIRCWPNVPEIEPDQKTLTLLAANGERGQTNRQNAANITLILEVISGLPNDSIQDKIELREPLRAGREAVVLEDIAIDLDALEGDSFSISVTAVYDCYDGFEDKAILKTIEQDCGILDFHVLSGGEIHQKDPSAKNYYHLPAGGRPLKDSVEEERRMFFGRQDEMTRIWNAIVDENHKLREGLPIILYGQKKCGKTTLINRVIGRMTGDPVIDEQAIIISIADILENCGGVTGLPRFTQNLYRYLLKKFKMEVLKCHPDVQEMLEGNQLVVPDLKQFHGNESSEFRSFFEDFAEKDQGRHRVVLIMDEFTRLCTTANELSESHPEYKYIPAFIKDFSGMGFIQIIIGHPNMMIALSELGLINHTVEFATEIKLAALEEEDARQLIRRPMKDSFGFDVYPGDLGDRAVERLLRLSGCHPSVLMKLCDRLFRHYLTTQNRYIYQEDVDNMLAAYLEEIDPAKAFDILLLEDGDEAVYYTNLPSYRYLSAVARESLHFDSRDCRDDIVCPEMTAEECYSIRDKLIQRNILSHSDGRVRIHIQLFVEYIRRITAQEDRKR